MRSFITLFAFAAAASAATSQLTAREDAQACAMKTLLSSSACNTGDAACLCSDEARKSVMQEIEAACGAEQSESTGNIADEACRTQKVRRATMPSATVVHNSMATPSSPGSDRVDGVQEGSDDQGCTCANTGSSKTQSNTPAVAAEEPESQDPEQKTETEDENNTSQSSHGSNTPSNVDAEAQSSRVHAPGMMATPAASSSAARHGAMVTPSSSSLSIPTPSGVDSFSSFRGAGAQVIPSMTVVASGVLAGLVGVLAAL